MILTEEVDKRYKSASDSSLKWFQKIFFLKISLLHADDKITKYYIITKIL